MTVTPPEVAVAWQPLRDAPVALVSPAMRQWQNRLFVLGSVGSPRRLDVYDIATDTWSTRRPMPGDGVIHPFVSHGENRMFVSGGIHPETGKVLNTLWIYHDDDDTWVKGEPMPGARHTNGAAIACGMYGNSWIFGGLSAPTPTQASVRRELFVYDYGTDRWTERAPMPVPRYGHSITHRRGEFYIVGGMELGGPAETMGLYDPILDEWSELPAFPLSSEQTASAIGSLKLLVTSAGSTPEEIASTHVYTMATKNWSVVPTTGHDGRTQPATARSGDFFYMVGGVSPGGTPLKSVMRISIPDIPDTGPPSGQLWPRSGPWPPGKALQGQIWPRVGPDVEVAHWYYPLSIAAGIWSTKANMPTNRRSAAGGLIGGKIYVAAGVNNTGSPTNATHVYDPAADTWTAKANIPASLAQLASAVYGGKLYTFGGQTSGASTATANAYCYDPGANTWVTRAAMPAARTSCRAAAIDGKIYVTGGVTAAAAYTPFLYAYDPVANSWSTKAAPPASFTQSEVVVFQGKVWVLGGQASGGAFTAAVYAYDPPTDTWTTKRQLPSPRASVAAVEGADGKLNVFGGTDVNGSVTDTTLVYDPNTDEWSEGRSLPTTLNQHLAFRDGAQTYLVAGAAPGGQTIPAPTYLLNGYLPPSPGGSWSGQLGSRPGSNSGFYARSGGVVDGKILMGPSTQGQLNNYQLPNPYLFDPVTSTWIQKAAAPAGVTPGPYLPAGQGAVGGKFYYLVGQASGWTNTSWVFDPTANTWTQLASSPVTAPAARIGLAASDTALGGKVYIVGGQDSNGNPRSEVYSYDPATNTYATRASLPIAANALVLSGGGKLWAICRDGQVYAYDPGANSWTQKASLPKPRTSTAGAVYDGKIHVLGGDPTGTNTGPGTADVQIYDIATDKWTDGTPLPWARHNHQARVVGQYLYVMGGDHYSGNSETFRMKLVDPPPPPPIDPVQVVDAKVGQLWP